MESNAPQSVGRPPSDSQLADRRATVRYAVNVAVYLVGDTRVCLGLSENMSEGGLFIGTQCLLPISMQAAIEFTLPGAAQPVVIDAIVRWVRFLPPGMGIQFLSVPAEHMDSIRAFFASGAAKPCPL